MKIAVLGGFGLMAEAALHDLADNPAVKEVLAADISTERAEFILKRIKNRRKIRTIKIDLNETGSAVRALKGSNCLLNCSWYEFNLKAMDVALGLQAHYVDLGGLYHMTLKQLKRSEEFRKSNLLGVLGSGSTPGITNMMIARMAPGFDSIDTVDIIDASHDPSFSEDSFLPPFSIRTMLDEWEAPAPILLNGRMQDVPAHSHPEECEFKAPLGRVKAGVVIHSETATLPAYLKAKGVRNLSFRIVYPESVRRQLALISGMGLSAAAPVRVNGSTVSPRGLVSALALKGALEASRKPSAPPRDFEVLRVRIRGTREGRAVLKTWDCEMRPTRLLSAGAIGVGWTGAIASVLAVQGRSLIPAGVGAPESVLEPEAFFRELSDRRAFRFVETVTHPLLL